ncbi:unnamed protein product, partial [Mesorhabditis belari]|uniref:Acyltransferase 3 domain-containing protein n=1 Tax=Mesorhabditis belari TaxID=2138241 RepID=A0AAF3EQY6_9BILA
MANKLGEIQALRALAIFYVFLYHLNEKWVPFGFLGVDMFFVISGYLMAKIFYEKRTTCKNSITFFERRFKRIMPCYGLMILCVVLIGRLCLTKIDRENLFIDAVYSLSIVSNMQSLFTTADYFELISEYKFLTHSWSLSAEMQFYMFVPLLFWVLQSISNQNKCFLLGTMAVVSALSEMALPTSVGFEVVTILSTYPLQYVGDISYVVYLVHWPVIAFYRNLWLLEEFEWSDYAKLILVISSLSIAIHHFVEQFFLTSDSKVCLYFTILCYTLSFLCIALPVSNSFEMDIDGQRSNDTICAALRIYPKPASFEHYHHDGEFRESYGELKGNGTFDVMVIGNSYLKSYQAYAEKPFRNRYNKFYMMARGMCTPFVNYEALKLTHDFRTLAEGCEEYNEHLFKTIEKIQPKILLMIMGKSVDILLLTMPMYYLSNSLAHKYNRIVESGKRFPERNDTMYAYQDYITQMKPMLSFLEELAKEIPNLYLVDVQAPFCRDGLTCDVYDYECGEFFFDWGGRHPTTFARNIVESSLRIRLDQVYNLLDEK